jgi:hypothetical protein
MLRLRWTFAAVCGLLLFLGGVDLLTFARNPRPRGVTAAELERGGAPARWLRVEGGEAELLEAISTSGTLELEALLVPLRSPGSSAPPRVFVETRDARALELFREYHFALDADAEREAFRRERASELRRVQVQVFQGMILGGLLGRSNRAKLLELARQSGFQVSEDLLILVEGKEPSPLRGAAFALLGLAGAIKLALSGRKPARP